MAAAQRPRLRLAECPTASAGSSRFC
jgi:hypothetical protein